MPVTALALLAALAWAAPAPPPAAKLDPDLKKLIEYVLGNPVNTLSEKAIPPFMEIDPKTLPPDLRGKVEVKQAEFSALQKVATGKRKSFLRRIGNDEAARCEDEEGTEAKLKALKMAGFEVIDESELLELQRRTSCSQCELQEEFTLRVLNLPPAKPKGRPRVAFLLYTSDPIFAVIASIRQGGEGPTAFFGVGGHPKCR